MKSLCFTLIALTTLAGIASAEDGQGPVRAVVRKLRPLHEHPTLLGMLGRNNSIRGRMGLRPHRMNPALTRAAQDHANYMASTGSFSHYTNGGPQYRAQRYGFSGGVRENIAWNQRSVDSVFSTWQASGGHMASIVSPTTDAGFGYAVAPNGSTYWVAVYGTDPTPVYQGPVRTTPAQPASTTKTTPSKPSAGVTDGI